MRAPPRPRLPGAAAAQVSIVTPVKGADVFVAPSAVVLGNVSIGKGSSIWYGATLRGDVNAITIGERTNIQDNVVIHVARHTPCEAAAAERTPGPAAASLFAGSLASLACRQGCAPAPYLTPFPSSARPRTAASSQPRATVIGNNVTVGHGALIHAATVGDGCLVGMGATLLDGVVLEPGSVVAGGAVVPPGARRRVRLRRGWGAGPVWVCWCSRRLGLGASPAPRERQVRVSRSAHPLHPTARGPQAPWSRRAKSGRARPPSCCAP